MRETSDEARVAGAGTRLTELPGGATALLAVWDDNPLSGLLGGSDLRCLAAVAWPGGGLTAHAGEWTGTFDPDALVEVELAAAMEALGLRFGEGWGRSPRGSASLPTAPETVEAQAARGRFMPLVDAGAVLSLIHFPFDATAYGLVAGAGTAQERLRQRLRDIPMLAAFLGSHSAGVLAESGLPDVADFLSREAGGTVTPGLLRRLRGIVPCPDQTREDTVRMLALLSRMPVDHVPVDFEGVRVAAYMAKAAAFLDRDAALSTTPMPVARMAARLMKALGADRQDRSTPSRQLEILRDLPVFAADVIRAFSADVVEPARRRSGTWEGPADGVETARRMLFGGNTLVEACETVGAWHRLRTDIERAMPPPRDAAVPWGRPCADFEASNGISVVPLLSWSDLVEEGDPASGLDHCVGSRGFAAGCAGGTSVILSFRSGGERIGTAELGRTDSSLYRVVQRHGRRNGRFPQEAWDAYEEWRVAVGTGALPFEWQPAGGCGGAAYAWEEAGTVEAAIAAWGPALPDRLKGLCPEDVAPASPSHGR